MLWAILCFDRPNAANLRAETRARHLAYLEARKDRVLFAGPLLSDDGQAAEGSVILVNLARRAEVEAFARDDPYAAAGLFERVVIRRSRAVFHEPRAAQE